MRTGLGKKLARAHPREQIAQGKIIHWHSSLLHTWLWSGTPLAAKHAAQLNRPCCCLPQGVQHLPKYVEFVSKPAADLGALLPSLSDDGVDLLRRMLCLNPADRITAAEALQHPYFSDKSPPTRSTPEEIITRYRRPLESPSSSP